VEADLMSDAVRKLHMPSFLQGFVLFEGLRGVSKENLPEEAIAGVTLAALMVPLNIGYAQIAGLPPQPGVFCSFAAPLGYALVGTPWQAWEFRLRHAGVD